jgi:hypothetical protein
MKLTNRLVVARSHIDLLPVERQTNRWVTLTLRKNKLKNYAALNLWEGKADDAKQYSDVEKKLLGE